MKSSLATVKKTKVSCTGRPTSVQSIYSWFRVELNKCDCRDFIRLAAMGLTVFFVKCFYESKGSLH